MSQESKIYISAGHYASSPGATGTYNGSTFSEYEIASRWVEQIVLRLQQDGYPVVKVPSSRLEDKIHFINRNRDALFAVELHFNSNVEGARGSESLYFPYSIKGKLLAEIVQKHLSRTEVYIPDRGVKEGWLNQNPDSGNLLYFLKATLCPSVIIEPEFMSNVEKILTNEQVGVGALTDAIKECYEVLSK